MSRPGWNEYFERLTLDVALRSSCIRAQHGAIIVRDNRLITTGYNGAPPGTQPCTETGVCYREEKGILPGTQYEACIALHAEQNAILQAAKYGVELEGATLYVTDVPCILCARAIAAVRLAKVIVLKPSGRYSMTKAEKILHDANVVLYIRSPNE